MIERDDWWQKILGGVAGVIRNADLSIEAVYDGNDDYRRVHFDGERIAATGYWVADGAGYQRVHFDGDQDALGRELDGELAADGADFRDMMRHMYPQLDKYPAGSAVFCPLPGCKGHVVEGLR